MSMVDLTVVGSGATSSSSASAHVNPDTPIPSIEDRLPPDDASDALSANEPLPSRLRTPSVSISPPPSSTGVTSAFASTSNDHEHQSTNDMTTRLQQINVSSSEPAYDMSAMGLAINTPVGHLDSRATSHDPEETPDGNRPARRSRRSRSRSRLPPHDTRDEDPPEDLFHQPAFQQAFSDARHLMADVARVLRSSSLHEDADSTMRRLHSEAEVLSKFQCPATRTVGFVGDSGVGKSSLLNSLLDTKDLARTSNSGEACTCVITEYHHHDLESFRLDVELFTFDEIAVQLEEMVPAYRLFHLHQNEMDPDERRDHETKANQAGDTFHSMFRGRLSEDELIRQPEAVVLERLKAWAREIMPAHIGGTRAGLTLEQCSDLLANLSSERAEAHEPIQWPYIRQIKVFVKSYILGKGLVLVDLPGLRDLNSARQLITERLLLKCDEIFVICNIGRAVSDAGIESVIELARKAGLSNVDIICTRSDDIRANGALRDWIQDDRRRQNVQRFTDATVSDRRDLSNATAERDEYYKIDPSDLTQDDANYIERLNRRISNAERRLEQDDVQLKTYLVTTHNVRITEGLRARYAGRLLGNDIRVFCVSNKIYWDSRTKPSDAALPWLHLSGILDVRRHCISIVANSQRIIATRYVRNDIPAVLTQVQLWVQSSPSSVSAERKQHVRGVLDSLESRFRNDLSTSSSEVNRVARRLMRDFNELVYDECDVSTWRDAAMDVAKEWSAWHHSSYSAFCRHYGDWSTGAVGSHDWNEQAMEKMVKNLETPWMSLRQRIQVRQNTIVALMEDQNDSAVGTLETELEDGSDASNILIRAAQTQAHRLIGDVEKAGHVFQTEIYTLRIDALSGIRSSFFGRAMEDSYQAGNMETGRGSDARRKAIINSRLAQESLFEDHMSQFRAGFRTLAKGVARDIREATVSFLDGLRGVLDIVRSENAALESEQNPEFRNRVDESLGAANDKMQTILAAMGL